MKLKDVLIGLFALALFGGLGILWLAPASQAQAPDFTFTTLQGEKLSMQELRGRPVLVNFWATTCQPCVEEMPQLAELYQELAPRGFEIIGVAMAYDPPNRVIALSQDMQIRYPIALDINEEAASAFGDIQLTPSTFLISPDGRIVHQTIGELDMATIRLLVLDMLAQNNNETIRTAQI